MMRRECRQLLCTIVSSRFELAGLHYINAYAFRITNGRPRYQQKSIIFGREPSEEDFERKCVPILSQLPVY